MSKQYQKEWYRKNREKSILAAKKWMKDNPERAVAIGRKTKLKLRYGITPEQLDAMVIRQDGRCAICLNKFTSRTDMHVDHNHTNGRIRDLLCRKCNLGIGYFNDNPLLTTRATEYLNKWTH